MEQRPPNKLRFRLRLTAALSVVMLAGILFAQRPLTAPLSVKTDIAELTWVQVRGAIEQGYTTAIVPSGGLEQNGVHMIIGKHDYIVRSAAARIAAELGHTLVTPVVSFVPEGDYDPPVGHMQYPGTIGVTPDVYAGLLEGIARSLKVAGFKTICLIADHGASLEVQDRVARKLNREWSDGSTRVINVDEYYADAAQVRWLEAQGETPSTIGQHGGIQDTSELLAVYPDGVRLDQLADTSFHLERTGASGDASRSSSERGQALLAIKIDAAVRQIRSARATQ